MAASPAAAFLKTIQFDAAGKFTESQMEDFKNDPQKYAKFVKVVEAIVNSRFPSVRFEHSSNRYSFLSFLTVNLFFSS